MLSEEKVLEQINENRENIVIIDASREKTYVSQIAYDTTDDKYKLSYIPINCCGFYELRPENFAIEDVSVSVDGSGNVVYNVLNNYEFHFWTNAFVYDALRQFHEANWTHPTIEHMFRTPHFK